MDTLRYDFTAPAGKHFGILLTAEEMLAAIPNAVDYWTPGTDRVTLVDDLVSEWTGALGRKLTQAAAARRPVLHGSELLFGNGSGGNKASLALSGTQIGAVTNLTIAGRFRLPADTLTADQSILFGKSAPNFRVNYRYAGGNNFLRFDTADPAVLNVDRDLPDGATTFGVILIISGGTALRLIVDDQETSATLAAQQTLSSFALGSLSESLTGHRGWIGRFGIWRHAATADQIAILKAWLAS